MLVGGMINWSKTELILRVCLDRTILTKHTLNSASGWHCPGFKYISIPDFCMLHIRQRHKLVINGQQNRPLLDDLTFVHAQYQFSSSLTFNKVKFTIIKNDHNFMLP